MRKYLTTVKNLLPPEDIAVNRLYTFNLSLDDTCLMDKHGPKSFSQQYEVYMLKLASLRHSDIIITCVPEISKAGRLHVHGVIKFNTNVSIAEFYLQLLGYPYAIEIDSIEDIDIWYTYAYKSSHIIKPLCQKYNKPYEIEISIKTTNTIIDSFNGK